MAKQEESVLPIVALFGFIALAVIAILLGVMWGLPHYSVWRQGLRGEAELRYAQQEKQIAVETAKAKVESARLEAEAEVERAKGMAAAIEAVGEMAQKYPEYKHQRFIEGFATALEEGKAETIIYVPTEANIPVLEAARNIDLSNE